MSLHSDLAVSLLKLFQNVALGQILCVTLGIKGNLARKLPIMKFVYLFSLLYHLLKKEHSKDRSLEDPPRRTEQSALLKLIGGENSFRMHIVSGDM